VGSTHTTMSNATDLRVLVVAGTLVALACSTEPRPDPLAAEIERWSTYVANETSTDALWTQVKGSGEPTLAIARGALERGHRLAALYRLDQARTNLAGCAFALGHTREAAIDFATFDQLWEWAGLELADELAPARQSELEDCEPAAVRALAEADRPQMRVYYDASREYGHATDAATGLFYLGAAYAQRDFIRFARTLREPAPDDAPELRALGPELDALGRDMLLAYRPPLSIDRHPEFIVAHAALNEARELDLAGLRHGALLRYLQASLRFSRLRADAPTFDPPTIAARLSEFDARLRAEEVDHSIARMLLEVAQVEVALAEPGGATPAANAIVADALPRYFAALEPAPPERTAAAPRATLTLIRWPYT
jgi:hypothetical protein